MYFSSVCNILQAGNYPFSLPAFIFYNHCTLSIVIPIFCEYLIVYNLHCIVA